jgi:uncharacterized repeat protein (TIGR03803 family)
MTGKTNLEKMLLNLNLLSQHATFARRRLAFALVLIVVLNWAILNSTHAQASYQTVRFLADLRSEPTALLEGKDHNLYGTMNSGGSKWEGVVFKLNKDGTDYVALHSFTGYRGGEDGSWPQGVVEGSDGVLYGTTQTGGHPSGVEYATGCGTVFKVNKDGSGYAVLHRFSGTNGDGIAPWAGLVEGRDGKLYGTTLEGGADNLGTIFRLNKIGGGYEVLHSFRGGEADGAKPMSGLLSGRDGSLYGTTDVGGSGDHNGTVFKLNPDGTGYQLLHSFAVEPFDGRFPRSSLVEGRDGALYGTTQSGGTNDAGTVFKLNKDGSGYRVLHGFTGSLGLKPDPQGLIKGFLNGAPTRFCDEGEGSGPKGLVQASDGALYGTAEYGGKNAGGTAFKLNADGTDFTILHNFPSYEGDGQNPSASLVQGSDKVLYGTTKGSSTNNFATVFKLLLPSSRPSESKR